MTRHHYGISALVSQTSFREETSGGVAKCRQFTQVSLYFSVSITFPFPSKQDNFTNASLDYNLLYLIDFRFVYLDLHQKRLNDAWLYGDKPLILKFLLYSPVAQPLNSTSNNKSQNGEKLYHTLFMASTNLDKSRCKFIMVAYGKVKMDNRLF